MYCKIIFFFSYWKDLLEGIEKLIMTIDDNTRDEKRQYDTNREAEK